MAQLCCFGSGCWSAGVIKMPPPLRTSVNYHGDIQLAAAEDQLQE